MAIDTLIILNNDYRRSIFGKITILIESWFNHEVGAEEALDDIVKLYNKLIDNENDMIDIERDDYERTLLAMNPRRNT